MKYFKNTELAKLYNISEKSVRNWIDASLEGKLDLQLYKEKDRTYVANTSKNSLLIEELVEKGKKYRNSRGFKSISPSREFYELYTPKQVFDIISNIDIHREIPLQYSFVDGGAHYWDLYIKKLFAEKSQNVLTSTISLLDLAEKHLEYFLENFTHVNVIDVGAGNCLPVKDFLARLESKRLLKRYICLDISKDMLEIARSNIDQWFKGRVQFEGYIRDVTYERFDDLLLDEVFGQDAEKTLNIVLFLGGTISNFREPDRALTTIHDSMRKNDLFIMNKKLDTEQSRRYFDFSVRPENIAHDFRDFVLEHLGVDQAFYEIEQFFDEKSMSRKRLAKLNLALSITFEHEGRKRTIELNKGESILLWQATHQDALGIITQLYRNGFDLLHTAKLSAQENMLLISQIQSTRQI